MRTTPRSLHRGGTALVAATLAALAFGPWQAEAALLGCSPGSLPHVTSAGGATAVSNCQYVSPPDQSNVASITNINAAGFFGFADWLSNGQDQLGGAGSTGASGIWSIANEDFATRDYIIVFKDGSDTNLIAFLFNEQFSSGNWTSPFTDPPFDFNNNQIKDVSHYTIAYRLDGDIPTDPQAVSEPLSLALFGMALAGLGVVSRRRPQPA
jgi:hypothetical protein